MWKPCYPIGSLGHLSTLGENANKIASYVKWSGNNLATSIQEEQVSHRLSVNFANLDIDQLNINLIEAIIDCAKIGYT